ncbi:hypothetical protein C8R44DRAFT_608018 [Mycena epipterygia]|nr:hypothetical protein C8R44DRAFT_608018 [Mycena epipterygia]
MEFLDLPLELLPHILSQLPKPQHIAAACRVNRVFHQFGIPRLYERASIYSWHKHAKAKVVSLFTTLARYPHLAKHVLRLEIRDFPKSVGAADLDELVVAGLKNCVRLQACTWTRDGALNSAILAVLRSAESLAELEINGHSDGHYDASILASFPPLQRISLIMPSADVVAQLPSWMARTSPTLRSLTLICKMSPLVTDSVLASLAPHLTHLEQFSITGCPRVSHLGIHAVLTQNTAGLRALALEGLSAKFNIAQLAAWTASDATLTRLTSFTLSIPNDTWLASVPTLLARAPLEIFQLYATSSVRPTPATDAFWRALVSAHGARLTRVSVHRMRVALPVIADLCTRCPALRELFVVVDPASLGELADCLACARALTAVHVNFQGQPADDEWITGGGAVLKAPEALAIVRRCPDTIARFGCNARVWKVEREIRRNDAGELVAERVLARYDGPDVPEQFLVVRT